MLCNTYQRKMWKSMISRKQLNINIWDAIEHRNETVYYMPYSGYHKFKVNTRFCFQCNNELIIGFRKNEFIVATCKCSADNANYATIEKLSTIFPISKSTEILTAFSDHKTRKFANRIIHWTALGYSKEEAKIKVSEAQTVRSAKSPASAKGARGYSVRTEEYWVKKGYTIADAKKKVSEVQVRNGLEWYATRYGKVEGLWKYNARIARWLESYNRALENDPTINERKMVKLSRASNQSLMVFENIYEKYKDIIPIYLGVDNNQEYFLRDDKTLYFYDFTIPSLKIMAEFNGSKFHPNLELLSESDKSRWTSLFSEESADVVLARDNAKIKLAEHRGYTVIIVWDTDDYTNARCNIEELIEERMNES